MIDLLRLRARLGRQTVAYPEGPARFPERFRGRPALDPDRCEAGCRACADACPVDAVLRPGEAGMALDLGRCTFCPGCEEACPTGAVRFTRDYRLAARDREALVVSGDRPLLAEALGAELRGLLGRSLRLRQVSAGGCNACEAELNATGNVQFDFSRFGVQFVASPRHADGVVVTGPVSDHMREALRRTWEATPSPKILVAVGACAISGGPFQGGSVAGGAAEALPGVPVDLFIPGCPPHPITLLDGLLRLLGRVKGEALSLSPTGIVGPARRG
ncbi:NADH-quinone oxidoreductase subunit B family protein [Anaeromyxobacter paludicola]|uniref:Hydrogenase n=1 Tax=Anaeromyxobacter paludicola TaxID=2918171 RepID=A0ABM7XEU0_9BACT|nr:4Fe-4S dicluster domain-containing protein [Anaeromyxobacter paludicola]BDG10409.1 hydrogenase [Anaeromyxobacter paludicola]